MIGVCIVTYNEEAYISQCIESVLCQKCSEKFVLYIGEDNSTDRTLEIAKSYEQRYSDMIRLYHRENNLGLVHNTLDLLLKIKEDGCSYVAMLDGDDWWSDEMKLQKELDFLSSHPDMGLVHTCFDLCYPNKLVPDSRNNYMQGEYFEKWESVVIGNCTVMFRTELLDLIDFEEFGSQGLLSCDYAMYGVFASKTKFGFLPDHTAVWRRGHSSVSNTNDLEKQINYMKVNDLAVWHYYEKLFPEKWACSEETKEEYVNERTFQLAFRFGDRVRALKEYSKLNDSGKNKYKKKHLVLKSRILYKLYLFKRKISSW